MHRGVWESENAKSMNEDKTKNSLKNQSGTTLVEFLVAMSIFAIFIAIAVGGFVQALANQRIILKLNAATDNMSLALEQMMREMRVGTNFYVGNYSQSIGFDGYDSYGNPITIDYSWDGSETISRTVISEGGEISTAPFTADNVTVSYFKADVSSKKSGGPSRIGLTIGITASDRGVSITNYIQTTVSSRVF
jgi:prepilin-type N-terminal cleavage/methylation domain-containing protein